MAADENEIIGRIRAGDPKAFESVFRSYYPALLRFARAGLGSEVEAEDAVHDVFLRIWGNRAALHVERSLGIYLFSAVRNRIIDMVRHRTVSGSHMETARVDDHLSEAGSIAGWSGPPQSASDPAELAELDAAIRKAIQSLPERGRTAFVLCREQEMTYAEAAAVMGVSPATVKTHMARALVALRAAVAPFLLALILIRPFIR